MKTSVVSKEYKQLQEDIIKLQENWKASLNRDSFEINYEKVAIDSGVPLVALTSFHLDFPLFLQCLTEVKELLVNYQPELTEEIQKVIALVDEETAQRWMEEAFVLNTVYFSNIAETHGFQEWILPFIAETIFRPYLQLVAEKAEQKITSAVAGCGCPVCGEPVRLGQLEGMGQKVLTCPRCSAKWLDKKLSCAHCGNDDYETMKYITVEGEAAAQIHVCESCKGYTKIIDTRQYLKKPSPQLLDLNTIHLDYIAQENGYQVVGEKK